MARSIRKSGGATRGRFKRKKMGKGWSTARRQPVGTRPVLKITPVADDGAESKTDDGGKAAE